MSDFHTCDQCGDVVGVYEPLVLVVDGQALETSQAAEPSAAEHATERFHRACTRNAS